jgi:signal transduction histidine kinase
MSHTIDDFRNFYKPKEEFKKIFLKEIILKIVTLISYEFKINNIQININIPESISFICLENQLQQALINILLNAKDAIISNNIENGMVNINAEKNDSSIILIIKDNAGGIKDSKILKRIFEPYFTTKNQSHGTGIGLYMTKIIIEENLEGNIEVKNIENGLEFKIQLPILIK